MHLRCDDELIARNPEISQRLARHDLGTPGVIDIGRSAKVAPRDNAQAHDAVHHRLPQPADGAPQTLAAAESHRAKTDLRYQQASIAELLQPHSMGRECAVYLPLNSGR